MRAFRPFTLILLLTAVLTGCERAGDGDWDAPTRQLLGELDGYVAARHIYMASKLDQLDAFRKVAQSAQDRALRYEAEMKMADEYFPFSFDSTQLYLKHCQTLARALDDRDRYDRASIQLGHLYAKAGNYMEAYNLLYEQIDTARLSEERMTQYLQALYDFSMDLSGNSGMVERFNIPDAAGFRTRLLERLPVDSETWRGLLRDGLFAEERYAAADSVGRLLLAGTKPDQHAYAIYAYYLSEVAERMGRPADRLAWLVRSAESDIINAVKDYASLTMVAEQILYRDVDRSFRYLRIAQEDAIFYNAKLRPWQISRFLMQVEDAYSARQERERRAAVFSTILLAVLTSALALLAWFYIARSRKLSRMRRELEQSNEQLAAANGKLNELNRQISLSDQVKESHIISFLESFSDEIHLFRSEDNHLRNLLKQGKSAQLLRELSASSRSEKAREDFYHTFDATFLSMYPDFVERFNELLEESARVQPPKGELNTELRIFALIRLGVDDSKQIARMLDYSLSTIYNYKVSVRNAALGDRSTFEQRVKMIGK